MPRVPIPPEAERVIRDAAVAEHAYCQLVRDAAEHPGLPLALMDRRVEVNAELNGEKVSLRPAVDLQLTLSEAVDRELEEMRSRVQVTVARRRQRKRETGCMPPQLTLSPEAKARATVRRLWQRSCLSLLELASAFGVSSSELDGYLQGRRIARLRQQWYTCLQAIEADDHSVTIVLRRSAPTKKNAAFYWRRGLKPKYKY